MSIPRINGTPVPPPQQMPAPQLLVNVVEIAPGVTRFHLQYGIIGATLDLPTPISKQVAERWVSEIAKTESSILIAPRGAVPGLT